MMSEQNNAPKARKRTGKAKDPRWDVVTMRQRQRQFSAIATAETPVGKYYGVVVEDGKNRPCVLSRQFIVEQIFHEEAHRSEVCKAVNKRLDDGEKISVAAAIRQEARTRWPELYGQPAQQSSKIGKARDALKELATASDEKAKLAALAALAETLGVSLETPEK